MQPKTEEFLYFLLWSMDQMGRPTFRKLTDSYENWAYRKGLLRQTAKLKQQKLLECQSEISKDRLYRLTEQGRLHALGGRDPEAQWKRAWDGRWRLVLFDVPVSRNGQREKLRRYLRSHGFGCLQGSVWISPDPLAETRTILAGGKVDVGSLLLLEAKACAGERDPEIPFCQSVYSPLVIWAKAYGKHEEERCSKRVSSSGLSRIEYATFCCRCNKRLYGLRSTRADRNDRRRPPV